MKSIRGDLKDMFHGSDVLVEQFIEEMRHRGLTMVKVDEESARDICCDTTVTKTLMQVLQRGDPINIICGSEIANDCPEEEKKYMKTINKEYREHEVLKKFGEMVFK